ncbi:LOW QUALITY PROTEIN: uncharacterized protein LOC129582249 [Paramacrobiotus metropolitanus]|uniref:LOW QUALITY PROTEIN: uncharacterized protein LOC129582249 n=1 Tax=Paramacrobiotus metropolitanus TaxID=2943436 RepID=UPI002445D3AE|nr:LOW QUALITY PROTEIN: uncharacterized protein LOC129582249 [Paramacrobiotus metropolitanus]
MLCSNQPFPRRVRNACMEKIVALILPVAIDALGAIMGGRSAKPVDVGAITRPLEEAMKRREQEYQAQRQRDNELFHQRFEELKNANAAERDRLMQDFHREQEQRDRERQAEQERYEARLLELTRTIDDSQEELKKVTDQLQKPIKDREQKIAFVNSLNLPIHQTNSLLLLGPKGLGKSTFLWLLNEGPKPKQSRSDGTVEILHVSGFVDSIGLRGWTPEELLKLLVLMIYDGIPKDLIVFGNDRIDQPITSLGLLGVNHPMIVIMSSDFWRNLEPARGGEPRIHLVDDGKGVRRVEPEAHLERVYNTPVYEDIKEFQLGITPITHHDNLELLVQKREDAGIRPFRFFMDGLGQQFHVEMENSHNMEALFRFIYLYEKKYGRDRLKFMNNATLQDFK